MQSSGCCSGCLMCVAWGCSGYILELNQCLQVPQVCAVIHKMVEHKGECRQTCAVVGPYTTYTIHIKWHYSQTHVTLRWISGTFTLPLRVYATNYLSHYVQELLHTVTVTVWVPGTFVGLCLEFVVSLIRTLARTVWRSFVEQSH